MSVTYNYGTCEAYLAAKEHEDDSGEWRDFTLLLSTMVMMLLVVKFPKDSEWGITDSNWRDVFSRFRRFEIVDGAWRYLQKQPRKITPQEVRSMIGLRVNAGNQTQAQFEKILKTRLIEAAEAALRDDERSES